jgi:hypothetical protein
MENQKVHQKQIIISNGWCRLKSVYFEFERSNQKMVNANPKLDIY